MPKKLVGTCIKKSAMKIHKKCGLPRWKCPCAGRKMDEALHSTQIDMHRKKRLEDDEDGFFQWIRWWWRLDEKEEDNGYNAEY